MGRKFEVRKLSMAKTQGAKIKVYSKYGKEIYVCAKNGGPDPESNLALRRLIEKAKKDQVPSHVIEKAIDKAKGGVGEDYATARYEGFGPGNCMVIVDCLTDNNNRTFMDVRQCFVKNNAKIGSPGTCGHMFEHQAVFEFKGEDEEVVLENLMMEDADVTDITCEDGVITVYAPHTEFFKVKNALAATMPEVTLDVEEISFVPQTMVELAGDDVASFEKFLDMLNDCDDVQNVYHNAEIAD
ncbi:YebC/PmpR family DNA-binding transcriptional regulator [Photobacterium damselae subsp. damselae]|uniref:YebC/PmpR family DNA-binding transcriptional regulator n=1 Tax=Photobacterium damselae TaxID=38293 RepID=UPI000A2F8CB0|nr:YebC/PmpR family DNA-binding transcriptional regulator [Photobacterium damselae]ARR51447.1 YebC/PmpR family DNA-binding transcriptional regulator [Photobacterium damselae subsp. damselae]QAY36771.1 YebC/PmpR family DNA-binding transcriptional regulator [Photobacterium damselae subsp. damselae]QOQ70652.1 YebC/PmpR family DNA-binding transcriptional regulator [Photobacterium damselae subsp. damselae]